MVWRNSSNQIQINDAPRTMDQQCAVNKKKIDITFTGLKQRN